MATSGDARKKLLNGGNSAAKVPTMIDAKEFHRTVSIVLAKNLKSTEKVIEVMKVLTVH